ncbi:MAG: amidohydrolase family protein [Pirellulaceae bacterium]|nr:amidohydrolase family protein [Pirellulaceae bacterium]
MIDVNVYLSRWPCRRLPCDDTPALVEKLRKAGVKQAWCGSFDALLHKDIAAVNSRLAEECSAYGGEKPLLVPFGAINPKLPDWKEDLRRCAEVHKMPGIRLHPNYHGYKLDDPDFAAFLSAATERKLIVQIAIRMEDPRTQHPRLQVPDVDAAPLEAMMKQHPGLRLVILNGLMPLRPDVVDKLAAAGASFDIATLEGIAGLTQLLKSVPLERILFGSYFPFFAWESAKLKLQESALARFQVGAITEKNAAAV